MSHPGGRPTSYKPEYCQILLDYFQNPPEKTFPLIQDVAKQLGFAKQTLYNWAEKFPEFMDALNQARDIQESMLINGGLFGTYNSTFAIFAAKNMIGWRDKTEISGDNERPVKFVLRKEVNQDESKSDTQPNRLTKIGLSYESSN